MTSAGTERACASEAPAAATRAATASSCSRPSTGAGGMLSYINDVIAPGCHPSVGHATPAAHDMNRISGTSVRPHNAGVSRGPPGTPPSRYPREDQQLNEENPLNTRLAAQTG